MITKLLQGETLLKNCMLMSNSVHSNAIYLVILQFMCQKYWACHERVSHLSDDVISKNEDVSSCVMFKNILWSPAPAKRNSFLTSGTGTPAKFLQPPRTPAPATHSTTCHTQRTWNFKRALHRFCHLF